MVLGSDGVISKSVATTLKGYATSRTVERWAGADRFASSATFSAKSFAAGVDVAYISSGENFPDALSAAPIAGKGGDPILLTRADVPARARSPPSSSGSSPRRSSSSAARA